VTQLGFSKGRAMLVRLAKALGPVLARLVEGIDAKTAKVALLSLDVGALGAGLQEFAERLTEQDLAYVCETFGDATEVIMPDGRRPRLTKDFQELHFAGHFLELFQWIAFAIEANYADFFDAARSLAKGTAAQQPA